MTVVATGVMMMGSGKVALAEETNSKAQMKTQLLEQRSKNKEVRDQIVENRCDVAYTRIDARLKNYALRKDNHIGYYQQARLRWQALLEMAEKNGKDVSELKKDLIEFDVMLNATSNQYAAFATTLEEAKTADCGDSNGVFKGLVDESKTELKLFREKVAGLKSFVESQIKPDLKALNS